MLADIAVHTLQVKYSVVAGLALLHSAIAAGCASGEYEAEQCLSQSEGGCDRRRAEAMLRESNGFAFRGIVSGPRRANECCYHGEWTAVHPALGHDYTIYKAACERVTADECASADDGYKRLAEPTKCVGAYEMGKKCEGPPERTTVSRVPQCCWTISKNPPSF